MRRDTKKIVTTTCFIIICLTLWGMVISKSREVSAMYINEDDHRIYRVMPDGSSQIAYPNEEHDPDNCPICKGHQAYADSVRFVNAF